MSSKQTWQKSLDAFLENNPHSADTRVLARALADSTSEDEAAYAQDIADLETALHIEKNLDAIGLQPTSTELQNRLDAINRPSKSNIIVWPKFTKNWQKLSAIAASLALVTLLYNTDLVAPSAQQPSLAEIQQAEQELKIAFEYLAQAQAKSSKKFQQTLDENIQQPINDSLLRPLDHLKESS